MAQKLTVDMILNKEFHIDFKGYNAQEVDAFLDDVMKDYEAFQEIIAEQKTLLDRYEETLSNQKRMILEYEGKHRAVKDVQPTVSYVDLLKRVTKLEDEVFNNK
ncbi:cell division protein [Erysipelothrix larvae]|uniref:Cell division protein n=1 Tax=Erysipelothrix larvae TaxID=1514105 RepID=A0A0X8GZF9_9FIRM|nr:DivIVA domain-containing protein [Erysipelothrix larvae]AMC93215.1 cell division protein [Erysipelothrix larvae]